MAQKEDGYTLVELLAVLTVVGVLMTIVAPSVSGMVARMQTSAALSGLTSDLWFARIQALRNGTRVEVAFLDRGTCGAPVRGRFVSDGYRIVAVGSKPRVLRETTLRSIGPNLCIESNNDRTIVFSSRGLPVPFENRTVWARRGTVSDSIMVSVLGRVLRRD